ncbi:MAG: hypothetical protein F4Y08_13690 [Caldilineaceae bacterium SB0662_bin_9]|uniref:Uncharacterized protein n=1 Tax=Caldilineaceae bacterium SB0662_bin_9 TaxID=2605258 RepID=A0A6B1DWJ7_9CHLR|nr:hypothetical protein [Caldilineaceae bacterium SB0662_bin_9]
MDLLLNDLSIHGQFQHLSLFRDALERIMLMRNAARRFGRDLYTQRVDVNRSVNPATTVFHAIQQFPSNEKRAILSWLQQRGPFWEDGLVQFSDDNFAYNGIDVTGTALAETAHSVVTGLDRRLVSLTPSSWEHSPLIVDWIGDSVTDVTVANYWILSELETALQQAEPSLESWIQLEEVVRHRCQEISFTSDCFNDLEARPFSKSAAERIRDRLSVLDQIMSLTDHDGRRTSEGQWLYEEHFKGDRARFSDSSRTEKRKFRQQLTFDHPKIPGKRLVCGFHGKVNNPPYRIHFTWPVPVGGRLYVVYVGWKLTIR